jgi:excisionase family DNA binding protein
MIHETLHAGLSNWESKVSELLTTREVQDLLQVDRTTIYRMVDGGLLPAIRVGKQWRFARREIERWLRTQAAMPVADDLSPAPLPALQVPAPTAGLADLLPIACVQMIQDAFAEALGVMIVVTDMEGKPVSQASNPCGLYSAVMSDADAVERCILHWHQMAGIVPLEPKFSPSDFGLLCARGLIRSGNQLKGMVFFGGIAPEVWPPDEQGVLVIAEHFGLARGCVAANIEGVYRLDRAARERALQFVQRIADIFAHILEDRNMLYGRLQAIASLTAF